jgi:hypothetical protein
MSIWSAIACALMPVWRGGDPPRPRNRWSADSIHPVGTLARIVDFDPLDDGLLGITCLGVQRLRVVGHRVQPDQLLLGQVQLAADDPVFSRSQSRTAGACPARFAGQRGIGAYRPGFSPRTGRCRLDRQPTGGIVATAVARSPSLAGNDRTSATVGYPAGDVSGTTHAMTPPAHSPPTV